MTCPRILVIEDEKAIREVVGAYLRKAGYDVIEAADGAVGLETFGRIQPDFVILDLMLPDISGKEVCQTIRRRSQVPILMLTAKVTEDDKIDGFRWGADDYVTKPFSPRELMVRVEAILKRSRPAKDRKSELLQSRDGSISLNRTNLEAVQDGSPLVLTPTELRLLQTFLERPGQVLSRAQLVEMALGDEFDGFDRTVDAHVKNLRTKIEVDSKHPRYLETVFGFGYRWSNQGICEDETP